jgi:outer membrane immunogenic protein
MKSAAAFAALCCAVLPASADQAEKWSGPYLGVYGGWVDAGAGWDVAAGAGEALSPEGPAGGFLAGYNWMSDGLTIGVEGNISFTGFSDTGDCDNPVFECSVDVNALGSLRGRAGVAVGDALIYGTGGLALSVIQLGSNEVGSPVKTQVLLGWTAGAGAEFRLSEGLRLGVEYRHSNYGDASELTPNARFQDFDLDTDEVSVRLTIPLN